MTNLANLATIIELLLQLSSHHWPMPLSRREIRTRATRFRKQWATAHNEDADAKPFWGEFFEVFGIRARTVGSYEMHVKKLSKADGYIDYTIWNYKIDQNRLAVFR